MTAPKGKAPKPYKGGDPNFRGNGKLTCQVCGKPYRDHRIGPCPALDLEGGRMTTTKPTYKQRQEK